MSTATALQYEINEAEGAAQKPDAAAFEAALARVEARAVEARAMTNEGNDKFRVQSADYARKELLKSLGPTVAALKVLNARVVEKADPEQVRAARSAVGQLIDLSVGSVKGTRCDG